MTAESVPAARCEAHTLSVTKINPSVMVTPSDLQRSLLDVLCPACHEAAMERFRELGRKHAEAMDQAILKALLG